MDEEENAPMAVTLVEQSPLVKRLPQKRWDNEYDNHNQGRGGDSLAPEPGKSGSQLVDNITQTHWLVSTHFQVSKTLTPCIHMKHIRSCLV